MKIKIKLVQTLAIIALAANFGTNAVANQVYLKNNATYPIKIWVDDGSMRTIQSGKTAELGDHAKLLGAASKFKVSASTLDAASDLDIISIIKQAQKQEAFINQGRVLNFEVTPPGYLYGWTISLPGWL